MVMEITSHLVQIKAMLFHLMELNGKIVIMMAMVIINMAHRATIFRITQIAGKIVMKMDMLTKMTPLTIIQPSGTIPMEMGMVTTKMVVSLTYFLPILPNGKTLTAMA